MMNEILQDLINIEEVISFIDDVIVEIKKKEEYNNVVEEVVERLAENDLFVKLEKCKWKVREVVFLGVVIELEGIIRKLKERLYDGRGLSIECENG